MVKRNSNVKNTPDEKIYTDSNKLNKFNLDYKIRINFCIKQKLILLNLIYSEPINSVLAFFYRKKLKSLVKYKLIKFLGRNLIHGKS